MSSQTVNGVSVFDGVPVPGQDGGMSPLDPPQHAAPLNPLDNLPADYRPSRRARKKIDQALVEAANAEADRKELLYQMDLATTADMLMEENPSLGNLTGVAGWLATGAAWIKDHKVLLFVSFVMTVAEALIIVLQLAYYRDLPGLVVDLGGVKIRAWGMFPIVDTGFTWACGMMAAFAVTTGHGNPRRYMRCMWAFASVSVFVSASHYLTHFADPTTALFVAGLSIATPFLWHLYVGLSKDIKEGVSADDIKLAVRAWVLHPVYSFRTSKIQPLLQCDRDVAWRYALVYRVDEFKKAFLPRLREQLEQVDFASLISVESGKPSASVKKPMKRVVTPPPYSEPEPEPRKDENVVPLDAPFVRPVWVTDDMEPGAVMTRYLEECGERPGQWLENWVEWLQLNEGFKPGLGRTRLSRWRNKKRDSNGTAAAGA